MKKGFTLIELLAVIVILAIIALIATPIVLNIINETRTNATLRSAEFYLDAVENSIALGILNNKFLEDDTYNISASGDICLNDECSETLKVEVKGEKPISGTIKIENGSIKDVEIKIESNNKTIVKNEKGELVFEENSSICTLVKDTGTPGITLGDEYICEVKSGTKYTFYVLSYTDKDGNITDDLSKAVTTNLIMDRNINPDGTPATIGIEKYSYGKENEIYNLVSWGYYESGGPVIAMDYLEKATSSWNNLTEMTVSEFESYSYEEEKNVGVHTMSKTYSVYARLPKLEELSDYDWENKNNGYLYNNLAVEEYNINDELTNCWKQTNNMCGVFEDDITHIDKIYGYWTSTEDSEDVYAKWFVYYMGYTEYDYVSIIPDYLIGVRPVINVQL